MNELFMCPRCRGPRLEEVGIGAIVCTPIDKLDRDGEVHYNCETQTIEGGELVRYQCADCGWKLPEELVEPVELYAYLTSDESRCCPPKGPAA